MNTNLLPRAALLSAATSLLLAGASQAQGPDFAPQILGDGHPTAVNLHGETVGWRVVNGGVRAFVASPSGDELLPLPAGTASSRANDINDFGVIVGNVAASGGNTGFAARWTPTANGYDVDLFDPLPDMNFATATAINNGGDIVGYSIFPGFGGGPATLFTDPGGSLNLATLGFAATPNDINDGRVLVGGQLRMDLDDLVVEDLGVPTGGSLNYIFTTAYAINEAGQVASTAYLATSSTNISIARYTDGLGWEVLSPSGPLNAVLGLNESGSVLMQFGSGAALPVALYRDGVGLQTLDPLLPTDWQTVSAFSGDINDAGRIAVEGFQSIPGEPGGALLLTPKEGTVTALGCGTNPPGSLTHSGGSAQPGGTLQLSVHDPLGVTAAGSAVLLGLSVTPATPLACGVELPGFGLAPGAAGALHLDLSSPSFSLTAGGPWTGAPVAFDLGVPDVPALSGRQVYLQGVLVDAISGPTADAGLTEGVVVAFGL